MRETVASETPSTADSDFAFTPSWSAARITASVTHAGFRRRSPAGFWLKHSNLHFWRKYSA